MKFSHCGFSSPFFHDVNVVRFHVILVLLDGVKSQLFIYFFLIFSGASGQVKRPRKTPQSNAANTKRAQKAKEVQQALPPPPAAPPTAAAAAPVSVNKQLTSKM